MTHPYLVPGHLPTGIPSVGFRLTAARLFGDRKSGSMEKRFKSVIVTHTCRDMPATLPERHPRKNHSAPADEFGGGTHTDLTRRTQPRSITCKEINK